MPVNLSAVQGNVLPGFNKDHQAFVLVHFPDREAARGWLSELAPEIASAEEVLKFNSLFKALRQRRSQAADPNTSCDDSPVQATWLNVALSVRGLRLFQPQWNGHTWSKEFAAGWVPGAQPIAGAADVHALLIVASDRSDDLERELHRQRRRLQRCNATEVKTFRGDTLPGDLRGHEHFGFKDGVSQPNIAEVSSDGDPTVATGEFVLGYADETGAISGRELPEWSKDGSFLAFVQLEQHVAAFWQAMRGAAEQRRGEPRDVAAGALGRDRAGSLTADPPTRFSHIGRAYPRWVRPEEANRHRLLRRGIPYGRPLMEGEEDDGQRGLLFVAYQADLARQFEYVWRYLLNGPDFPVQGAGTDAVAGQPVGVWAQGAGGAGSNMPSPGTPTRPVTVQVPPEKGGLISLHLPAFVTPRYGEYFFAPSISALTNLGTGAHDLTTNVQKPNDMYMRPASGALLTPGD